MQNFINGIMWIMLNAPVTCIGAVVLIIFQMPGLLPLMLIILICAGLLIYGNMKLGYPRFDRMQKKLDGLNNTSREFLNAIRVVKAFRAEDQEREKFEEASGQLAEAGISSMRVMAVFGPLINLTVNVGIVVMVSNILNSAVRAAASSARVQEILDEVPAQREAAPVQVLVGGAGCYADTDGAAAADHSGRTAESAAFYGNDTGKSVLGG